MHASEETVWTQQGVWRGGQRFLRGTMPYLFTKHAREIQRLNLQHYLIKSALAPATVGRSFCTPIKRPRMILDVASGSGIWGREMAQHFKQATVWNIDKDRAVYEHSQSLMTYPDNFRFQQWEYPAPLPFAEATFDYVHARFIELFVPLLGWTALIREMQRVLVPGGWLALMESEQFRTSSPTLARLQEQTGTLLQRFGLAVESGPKLAAWLGEAEFQKVQTCPIEVGKSAQQHRLLSQNVTAVIANAAENLVQYGVAERAELAHMQQQIAEELPHSTLTITYHAAWGQKPPLIH